jgi:Zn-dependent peptidase ImmA (M78 family)
VVSGGAQDGNSVVSKIEKGRLPADTAMTAALAEALECGVEFLLSPQPEMVASRPWLRAYADAPARVLESVVADNLLVEEVVRRLKLQRMPERMPTFDGDANDDHEIEQYAEDVRLAADNPEGSVVPTAVRAAERLGCVVLPLPGELGRHLGMSQRIDGVPFIRVSRPGDRHLGVPGDRQRFTLVHEIGHLGMHAEVGPPESADDARIIERQAHRFAGAFLTPAEPLLEDWHRLGGRVTLTVLKELKATWGVSIKALVMRLQQLGVVESDQATSLYRQISARGWNKSEPVETTNEEPIWLPRALARRFDVDSPMGGVREAARALKLSEAYIRPWIDWSPISATGDVLELPSRPRPTRGGAQGEADVISMAVTRKRGGTS